MNWKPIDNEAKSGRLVLLGPNRIVGWWDRMDEAWIVFIVPLEEDGQVAIDWRAKPKRWHVVSYDIVTGENPTVYQPLPPPPEDEPRWLGN